MLILHCPSCDADRPETEFVCGGPLGVVRPGPPDRVSDADWAAYLHHAPNPLGLVHERWCHRAGCGTWFAVVRDTATHAIRATAAVTDPAPELS